MEEETTSSSNEGLIPLEMLDELATFALEAGTSFLLALVTLIIGFWIARRAAGGIGNMLDKRENMDATLKPVLLGIVRYTIIAATMVAVLSQFGIEIASIIAVLGAIGLAVGLALQGTLSNVAAGVMLLSLRHFKVGDFITAAGHSGVVVEIGIFSTELRTGDGVFISVPNGNIWGAAITNFSRNSTRRIDVIASISYDDDLEAAMPLLMDMMKAEGRFMGDPEPVVFVAAMAASSIDIQCRGWVKSDDYWGTLWDFTKAVKLGLEANGFSIPYPQQDVHMHQVTADSAEKD